MAGWADSRGMYGDVRKVGVLCAARGGDIHKMRVSLPKTIVDVMRRLELRRAVLGQRTVLFPPLSPTSALLPAVCG